MGQGGFPAAGETGEPDRGASVAVKTVAVGLLDAALEWEDVGFHLFYHGGHEKRFWVLGFGFWVLS